MNTADRFLWIHMDAVTSRAPIRRRRKQRHGPALTIALLLMAVAAVVFGHGIL